MTTFKTTFRISLSGLAVIAALALPATVQATIPGVSGPSFSLTADAGYIGTPDGGSVYMWGYGTGAQAMQYPGPTLIVNKGQVVTITLTNRLDDPVSIVFPGQAGVTATGGTLGLLTREAFPGGTVQYSFTASNPGTYMYHSGTNPELQIEMGLVGALIVRPSMGASYAYEDATTRFDSEYLFLLTEVSPGIHALAEQGRMTEIDLDGYFPLLWFINGRCAPDTMADAFLPWLPNQPYNSMPMMHPGDKMLCRYVGAGRHMHPFHQHANHVKIIAEDGRLLSTAPAAGPDLAQFHFTVLTDPGRTYDGFFEWTGERLGWDIYGHQQDIDKAPAGNFPGPEDVDHNKNGVFDSVALEPNEYAADHGKPIPVVFPEIGEVILGPWYSGSPFLGDLTQLPSGEGIFNLNAGYFFMWHSHTEKEMVNNDVFPGGMMTMIVVEAPWVPIMM